MNNELINKVESLKVMLVSRATGGEGDDFQYTKGAAGTKPAPRHAELAVNLSGAMATFLLQTWEARKK